MGTKAISIMKGGSCLECGNRTVRFSNFTSWAHNIDYSFPVHMFTSENHFSNTPPEFFFKKQAKERDGPSFSHKNWYLEAVTWEREELPPNSLNKMKKNNLEIGDQSSTKTACVSNPIMRSDIIFQETEECSYNKGSMPGD